MKLDQKRADILSNFLNADADRAKRLLVLEPSAALSEINAAGHDFTLDELKAYGEAIKKTPEMSDDALSGVAGGLANNMDLIRPVAPIATLPRIIAMPGITHPEQIISQPDFPITTLPIDNVKW